MASNTVIPPPPRLDMDAGDLASVAAAVEMLHKHISTFHQAAVGESRLLDPSHQADAGTFDADNLPDPTDTSIAKAQDVANRAYALAQSLVP